MIERVLRWRRRWKRVFSRTRLAARLLGRSLPHVSATAPGLVILQLDGLSRTQVEKAMADGRMPFLATLIRQGYFEPLTFYSGLPSTTPAVQAEVMFGARCAVPAFHFLDRESGRSALMFDQEWAEKVGSRLAQSHQPLLVGGRSYSNIYAAGADEARFCAETLKSENLWDMVRPWKLAIVLMLYSTTIIRVIGLALIELAVAIVDLVRGVLARESLKSELRELVLRVLMSVCIREWLRVIIKISIAEGAPIVFGNFLGYDEQSHRRGPASRYAHWGLGGIDSVIRDVVRTAHWSAERDYEIIVYSDHGQEATAIYENKFGRTVQDAVAAALSSGRLANRPVRAVEKFGPRGGETDQQGRRLLRIRRAQSDPTAYTQVEMGNDIYVAATGPLGHIYLPFHLDDKEKAACAQRLINEAQLPAVFYLNAAGEMVIQINESSRSASSSIDPLTALFGVDHPFLPWAKPDLERLLRNPNSGDLLFSGWTAGGKALTFVQENGAHGSIGSEETRGFVMMPHSVRFADRRANNGESFLRGCDLYQAAWNFVHPDQPLEAQTDPEESSRIVVKKSAAAKPTIRVMTYNIHSCIGMDGKVRPDRIAAVIRGCRADIVALQEVDAFRSRTSQTDQAHAIATALGMKAHFYPIVDSGEQYGLAILSRFPMRLFKANLLSDADPDRRSEARGAMWCEVETDFGKVQVINTHFGLRASERSKQVDTLLSEAWIGSFDPQSSMVLCGDFNAGPRSPTYQRLSTKLRDVQSQISGASRLATFASIMPVKRLDYIFASQRLRPSNIFRPQSPTARIASDHLPICVELAWSD